MLHPNTELRFINDAVGYGVVATTLIPKGTITWVHDPLDRVFTAEEVRAMAPEYRRIIDKYTFRDNTGNYILCWDHARFVNHSFRANCISTAYDFELAVRDIQPGEELTDDYGYLNLEQPMDCLPEKGTRRRRVMPDDLLHYSDRWDRQLRSAFRHFNRVDQPLLKFLSPETIETARAIGYGKTEMESIIRNYFFSTNDRHV